MTEFWKSNPKKFCEFCRVWFADNKSSIDFHERGKKHQENVQRKIGELTKKGLKQHEAQQHTKNFLQQMEEDALKAFKKDAQKDSSLVTQYNQAAVEFKVRQFEEEAANEPRPSKQSKDGTWYECKNQDGYSYYWNDVTEVSQWEEPAKFVPYQDTSSTTADSDTKEKVKTEEDEGKQGEEEIKDEDSVEKSVKKEEDEKETKKAEPSHKGERKRKGDAYGQWTEIVNEESTPVDLQLPESARNYISQYQPQVEQRQPVEEIEFGTKTIPSLAMASSSGEKVSVGFKKRKMKGGGRSLRQRDET
ncbi:uncharacterized protein [Apostichopus japonicus]|uniref:uncharacterized protein n=1 Tax=Stichopus japonicus TaxID=307972 RepID=UPI003AB17A16